MFLLDSLLVGSLRFVLDKVAAAVAQEMDDETVLREELLAAQMRLELGELDEGEFAALEKDLLGRLREIRERREGLEDTAGKIARGELRVTGVEATFEGDGDSDGDAASEGE